MILQGYEWLSIQIPPIHWQRPIPRRPRDFLVFSERDDDDEEEGEEEEADDGHEEEDDDKEEE